MTERNSSLYESTEWSIPSPSGFSQMPGQPLESRNLNTIFLSSSDRLSNSPWIPLLQWFLAEKIQIVSFIFVFPHLYKQSKWMPLLVCNKLMVPNFWTPLMNENWRNGDVWMWLFLWICWMYEGTGMCIVVCKHTDVSSELLNLFLSKEIQWIF